MSLDCLVFEFYILDVNKLRHCTPTYTRVITVSQIVRYAYR